MNDFEVRLECLRIAQNGPRSSDVIKVAEDMYAFVTNARELPDAPNEKLKTLMASDPPWTQ